VTILPRQIEYALLALGEMHVASPGQLFAVRGICEKHHIPFDVVSKTMQRLSRAEILRSVKGVNGGYQIIKDLGSVSLLEIIDAVMGSVSVVMCLDGDKVCPIEKTCTVMRGMSTLDKRLKTFYRDTTVLELIEDPTPSRKS
jgi:Rrf2 family protein